MQNKSEKDKSDSAKLAGVITVPFHIGDFLSGTMHMDTLEKGAYIMLLCAHYQTGENGLPADDKKLSRIAGVSPKVWKRIRPILSEKFFQKNDFWVSKKVLDVLRKVHEKSSSQRAKALKKHSTGDAAAEPWHSQPKPKPKPKPIKNNIIGIPDGVTEQTWQDFIALRRKKKAEVTQTALNGIEREAAKAGWGMEKALSECCARGWTGFKAEWVSSNKTGGRTDAEERRKKQYRDMYDWATE